MNKEAIKDPNNTIEQNIPIADPNIPLFSIASGEQRSRGLEFDIATDALAVGMLTGGSECD